MPSLAMWEEEFQMTSCAQESDNFACGYNFFIIPPKMLMPEALPGHGDLPAHRRSVLPLPDSVFPPA